MSALDQDYHRQLLRAPFSQKELKGHIRRMLMNGEERVAISETLSVSELTIANIADELRLEGSFNTLKQQATAEQRIIVNYNHLITLLQKGYTTIKVQFKESGAHYTYKATEEMELAPGDLVVVPVKREGEEEEFKIVTVVEVHPEPEIDVKAPYALKWVVSKLDLKAYNEQVDKEEEAVKLLQRGERKKAAADALDTLLANVPDRQELLKLLGQ